MSKKVRFMVKKRPCPTGAFYGQEVRAGNACAGLGSVLCHRKPKLLPTCLGQHTFRAISKTQFFGNSVNVTRTHAPNWVLTSSILPPCASTSDLEMASPKPLPPHCRPRSGLR